MNQFTRRLTYLAMLICGSAHAATFPSAFEPMRMSADEGLVFSGFTSDASFGLQAVALGDVNGDNLADIALGTDPSSDNGGIFIVYGSPTIQSRPLSPGTIASAEGTFIPGLNEIYAIGDFNGDGLNDWLLRSDDSREGPPSGAAIVLGRTEPYPTPLDINSLANGSVMHIVNDGVPVSRYMSDLTSVASELVPVGDVNGDGKDDLAVFSTFSNVEDRSTITIILGMSGLLPSSMDIATVPDAWRTTTRFPYSFDGSNYTWVGAYSPQYTIVDANADGINDLLYGETGAMYLVFGSKTGLPPLIDVQTLNGTNGSTLLAYNPDRISDQASRFTESFLFSNFNERSFDVDGDAIGDLLLNSYSPESSGDVISVLYGRSDPWPAEINLQNLPSHIGRVIDGLEFVPQEVGDINDDGFNDWYVERFDGGTVMYGRANTVLNDVTADGLNGFRLAPTTRDDYFQSVSTTKGDFNGDGIDDLLLGSPGAYAPGVDIDVLIDEPYSDEYHAQRTGVAYVIFGRRESGAPASPWNVYPAFSYNSIDLRWELPNAEVTESGFEIQNEGRVIATLNADERSFEIVDAPRYKRQTYTLVTLSATGRRSAPLIVSVNNDVDDFPELGGEVYSDTLAEIFWIFENREYDIYRNGKKVDRLMAQSWLDTDYDPSGHVYRIETVNRFLNDRVRRSAPLTLPAQTGTRPPGAAADLDFALYSEFALELFWKRAAWGTPPFSYEVSRNDEVIVTTTATSLMDYDIERYGGYRYKIVTIDSNGRRSAPAQLIVNIYDALAAIRPAKPDNLTSQGLSTMSVRLQWEPSIVGTPATGYDVLVDGNRIGQTTDTHYTLTGLEPDTPYYSMEVVSFNADGQRSEPVYAPSTATLGGPLAPMSAEALAYGPRTVELFWSRVEGNATPVERYDVYRNGELIDTVVSISYMDFDLNPDTEYTYTIRSVSADDVRSSEFVSTTVRTFDN